MIFATAERSRLASLTGACLIADLPPSSIVEFMPTEGPFGKTFEAEPSENLRTTHGASFEEPARVADDLQLNEMASETSYEKASEQIFYTMVVGGVTADGNSNCSMCCFPMGWGRNSKARWPARANQFPHEPIQIFGEAKKRFSIQDWDGTHPDVPLPADDEAPKASAESELQMLIEELDQSQSSFPAEPLPETQKQIEPQEEQQMQQLLQEYEQQPFIEQPNANTVTSDFIESECMAEVSKELTELENLISQEQRQSGVNEGTTPVADTDPLAKTSKEMQHLVEEIDLNEQIIQLQTEVEDKSAASDSVMAPTTDLSAADTVDTLIASSDAYETASEQNIGLATCGQSTGSVEYAFAGAAEKQQASLTETTDQCSPLPAFTAFSPKQEDGAESLQQASVEETRQQAPVDLAQPTPESFSAPGTVVGCVQNGQLLLGPVVPSHPPILDLALLASNMPADPTSQTTHGTSHFAQSFETTPSLGGGPGADSTKSAQQGDAGGKGPNMARDKLAELEYELRQLGMSPPQPGDTDRAVEEILQTALDRLGPGGDLQVRMHSDTQKKTTTMVYESEMPGFKGLGPDEVAQLQGQLMTKLKDATEAIRATKDPDPDSIQLSFIPLALLNRKVLTLLISNNCICLGTDKHDLVV